MFEKYEIERKEKKLSGVQKEIMKKKMMNDKKC